MAEELENQAEETQEPVVPKRDDIPEKFWGKPVTEVIESYKNAEKLITQKSQEFNQLMEKLEDLSSKLNTEDVKEEKEEEDDLGFEFITKKDLEKILQEKQTPNINPEEIETKVASTILAEIERRDFIRSHSELFQGKTQEQAQQLISKIASVGLNSGAKNLEDAYKEFTKFAEETLGVSLEQVKERPVPSADMGGGREIEESPDNLLEHMIDFHKKHGSGLSGMIKY